jgi:hypothetical protein
MKKLFEPVSLLFYFFMVLVFFFAGVYFAGLTGAAEGQGLAGGAIILGYGVIAAFFALLFSVFMAYSVQRDHIVRINKILGIIFLIFIAITTYRIFSIERSESSSEPLSQQTTKEPASSAVDLPLPVANSELGLGLFKPDFFNQSSLLFYENPNFEKPVSDHSASDSVTFQQIDGHRYDIAYAPPWLVPEHLKMDYEILYFRIKSIHRDFLEIVVNKSTQKKAYVDRTAEMTIFWPDFLLNVQSIEFPKDLPQTVRVKPLNYAGQVSLDFEFMKPIQFQYHWMEVELLDRDFQKTGTGWVRWRDDEKLLIEYSLLS